MDIDRKLFVVLIGYFLAIFFSFIGLIYGLLVYYFKKESEMYSEHSKNIMAVSIIFIIIRLFIQLGSMIF